LKYAGNFILFIPRVVIITTLVTPTKAQFHNLFIYPVTKLLNVSPLSPSSGSLQQHFAKTYSNTFLTKTAQLTS